MKINQLRTGTIKPILLLLSFVFIVGCGGGGSDEDNSIVENEEVVEEDPVENIARNEFAGIWLISKEDTVSFWIFNENGTFQKKRAGKPITSANHFVGTYIINDGQLRGEFTNPGVGKGAIEGSIALDGSFEMDFIEFWHTPTKVVPCIGIRQ